MKTTKTTKRNTKTSTRKVLNGFGDRIARNAIADAFKEVDRQARAAAKRLSR